MTNEEAIHQLECIKEQIATYEINTPRTKVKSWPKIVDDAIKMAEEALRSKSEAEEYRTPQKVEKHKTHCNGKDFTYKITCPSCEKSLCGECFDKKAPYCMWCGQALDWSEVE